MINFPQTMPTDAMMLLIDKIRGKQSVSNKDFAQALWNLVGYAADQAIPSDTKPVFQDSEESLDEFASILEEAVAMHASGGEARKLPWANILRIGIKLLISILL